VVLPLVVVEVVLVVVVGMLLALVLAMVGLLVLGTQGMEQAGRRARVCTRATRRIPLLRCWLLLRPAATATRLCKGSSTTSSHSSRSRSSSS
jgi:hypothetical protein